MPFWLKAVSALVILAVLSLFAWGASMQTAVSWLFVVAAVIPYVIQQTPALYFRWTRLRFRVTNVATTWSLGIRIAGDFSTQAVEQFARQLAADTAMQTRVLEVSY